MSSGYPETPPPTAPPPTTSREESPLTALPNRVRGTQPRFLVHMDSNPTPLAFHTAAADSAWPCRSRASFRSFLMISTDPLFSWKEMLVMGCVTTSEGLGPT